LRWRKVLDSKGKNIAAQISRKAGFSTVVDFQWASLEAEFPDFQPTLDNFSSFAHILWKSMCASYLAPTQVIDFLREIVNA
jgi:hypothetical protein